MKYRIIDEEVIESIIRFLDDIQFSVADEDKKPKSKMNRTPVEIINMCSYFISEFLNSEEVYDDEIEREEDPKRNIDKIIEFQIGEMPDEDYEKLLRQFDSFFKNFKQEYHKSKTKQNNKSEPNLKHFTNQLKKDKDLTNDEKFELYYDEYIRNKQKQGSKGLSRILKDLGLNLSDKR